MRALRCLGLALAALAWAVAAHAEPVVVYGIEVDRLADRDRLLVSGQGKLDWELEERDAETLVLRIANARLHPTAELEVRPPLGSGFESAAVFEPADTEGPEVHVLLRRPPGQAAEVSQRGSMLAIDFARPEPSLERLVKLQFVEAEIADVVRQVAGATGHRFVLSDDIDGRVTLLVPEPVPGTEALALLDAALLATGHAAVPSPGGARTVLPIDRASAAAPWREDGIRDDRGGVVATRVALRTADALEAEAVLRPLLPSGAVAVQAGALWRPWLSLPRHRSCSLAVASHGRSQVREHARPQATPVRKLGVP